MTRSKGTLALSTIELPKPFLVQAILQISNMSLINDLAKNLLLFFCCSKFSGHKSFTGTVITWRFPSDAFPQLPTNCLSVLDHFVELALKGFFLPKKVSAFLPSRFTSNTTRNTTRLLNFAITPMVLQ